MFDQRRLHSCLLLIIVTTNCLLHTYAYPQNEVQQLRRLQQQRQQQVSRQSSPVYRGPVDAATATSTVSHEGARKFAVKPNASKKVALDDVENEVESNQLQETASGFTWSNVLSTMMMMFFNGAGQQTPSKSDDIENPGGFGASPWANVISMGLKIINALLGGGAPSDGIDKVDNGGSPMQGILAAVLSPLIGTRDPEQVNSMAKQAGEFIQIVMNLLDALKTSFSHRSLTARSSGKRDSMSDAVVASASIAKGFAQIYGNSVIDETCMQRYLCESNKECVRDIGGKSVFCQLGSYAASYAIDKMSRGLGTFDNLYEACRHGRTGANCTQVYHDCNEV